MNETQPVSIYDEPTPSQPLTVQFTVRGSVVDFIKGVAYGFLCGLPALPFLWLAMKNLEARGLF
ncbi:hypothetical protein [Deinococcus kurensis]|uniref:hypothetical protein n=1 Tax=Deinococcus kurensis TaxID=2662757 RepID=UPI0012D353BC|nr:hypothetical protein [Deinococcus kurensis]